MFFEVVSIIFGAIIGSFLNVCICRLPRDESIVSPGSHCPQCKNPIRAYDNIPLVSYVLLGGKCRYCRRPISVQYPLVEGVTALASFSLFMKFGPSFQYLYFFAFLCSLIVVTVIDLHHQIIPDVISLPGIAVGLLGAFALPQKPFLQAIIGVLVGGGSLFVVATVYQWVLKREGMGGGDVKLLAMIGAFLGWKAVILTIVLSSLIGSIVGILVMAAKGKDFKYAIPFGPFLSLGATVALFYGESMIRWYVTLGR
jgi:leader peptidase (prepilin peptidase)/N-methyltransferase